MKLPLAVQQTDTVLGDFQLFRYDFLEVFDRVFSVDQHGKAPPGRGGDVQRHGGGAAAATGSGTGAGTTPNDRNCRGLFLR